MKELGDVGWREKYKVLLRRTIRGRERVGSSLEKNIEKTATTVLLGLSNFLFTLSCKTSNSINRKYYMA